MTEGCAEPDANSVSIGGPFFDDLRVGDVFDAAPSVTLTAGHAAVHQSIVGSRMRLPLDDTLAMAVAGRAPLAHPALVWDVAIGQSTLVTHHVRANLFYRGLAFHGTPCIGDTLRTTTEVVGLRQNRAKPGRHPTGLVVLRVTTVDQRGALVLDFCRCAMLPLSDPRIDTRHNDDLDMVVRAIAAEARPAAAFREWRLDLAREALPGQHFDRDLTGCSWNVSGGDVVSSAPELARLTLNIAQVHHDALSTGSQRLVYGGHCIGLALAQANRALPNLIAIARWESCEHLGPVHEGDTLRSRLDVERTQRLGPHGGLVSLRSRVTAQEGPEHPARDVLDWRFAAVLA